MAVRARPVAVGPVLTWLIIIDFHFVLVVSATNHHDFSAIVHSYVYSHNNRLCLQTLRPGSVVLSTSLSALVGALLGRECGCITEARTSLVRRPATLQEGIGTTGLFDQIR